MKLLKEERGISLVEVIASIVLLSIILLSFFTLILQSNKATHKSNGIMNSTYMAQIEMENLYNYSSNACSYEDLALGYTLNPTEQISYTMLPGVDKTYVSELREGDEYNFYLTVETFLEGTIYNNAVYVHLDVIEKRTNSKATMENVWELGGKRNSCNQ